MSKAEEIWAIVVGIDIYDRSELPKLGGAVLDAVEVVRWLDSIGVDRSRVRFHISPTTPVSEAAVSALNLSHADARALSIWGSINELAGKIGDKLFVVLSGHGLYEPATGPIFLAQDYGVNNNWSANLGLEKYVKFFLGLSFQEQYLFFDGCQNYPGNPNERAKVAAQGPFIADYTPKPENGLVACFAASQGERALEIGGRSAMLRRLIQALDPETLTNMAPYDWRQDAIDYDWKTGARSVDLRKLFYDQVQPLVTEEAKKQGYQQIPQIQPFGRSTSQIRYPILTLPRLATSKLVLDIAPREAIPAIAQIRVRIKVPSRERHQPVPPSPLTLPDRCCVPQLTEIEASCTLNDGELWTPKRLSQTISVTQSEHDFTFKFEHLSPQAILQPPPGLNDFNLRLMKEDSLNLYLVPGGMGRYQQAITEKYVEILPKPSPVSPLSAIWQPEGLDLVVEPGQELTGVNLANRWARAIALTIPERSVQVVIAPPGRTVAESIPNLRFILPKGGAKGLAGHLAEVKLVTIDRSGTPAREDVGFGSGDYSLAEIVDLRVVCAERGVNRVRIDLPWGSWANFVEVPDSGTVAFALPEKIGIVPLRHLDVNDLTDGVHEFKSSLPGQKPGMFLYQPRGVAYPWYPDVRFRYSHRAGLPCVEPYSAEPVPEWDLLVTTGRLEAFSPARLSELCTGHGNWPEKAGERGIFGLAVAYAAYAARSLVDLTRILYRLPEDAVETPDARLLALEAKRLANEPIRPDDLAVVIQDARAMRFPVFRWGATIFLRYATEVEDVAKIAALISPASVWTVIGPRVMGPGVQSWGRSLKG